MAASVAEIMDNEQEKGIGTQMKVHFDVISKETDPLSRSNSSSSSSLSDSSLESIVIDKELRSDPHLESGGPVPVPEASFEISLDPQTPPPLQAPPPVQVMGTTAAGYDPSRIPFSIFTPKPANATDWSVASNESLFSIHMGNNSFSRDHFILASRSGELPMFSESNNILAPLSPVSEESKDETRKENMGHTLEEREVTTEANKVAVANMAPRDYTKEHMPPIDEARSYVSVSCRSDESNNSTRSFHFPVFAGDGARSSSVTTGSYAQNSQNQGTDSQNHEGTPNSAAVNWFSSLSCCLPCHCRCP